MNSFTSSSEPPAVEAAAWRRVVLVFLGSAAALLAGLMLAVAVIDPFDTGLLGAASRGTADEAPRLADASRARDPAFTGAILGNSHLQLVDPGALTAAAGLPFVSLTIPGTGAREQLAVLDSFLHHHAGTARALVLGLDPVWCIEDPALPLSNPFPFWLYDPGPLQRIRGLLRYASLEHAGRALATRFGLARPARRDGYWNYALGRTPAFAPPSPPDPGLVTTLINDTARFPALMRLGERLAALPPAVAVVLVRPPVYAAALPPAGSTLARAEAECRAATAALLPLHGASALVDARIDDATARDASLWFDTTHYAEPVARALEREIGAALTNLRR